MWADVDTKQDFLNYSEVADLVVDVIRDRGHRFCRTAGVRHRRISHME